MCYNKELHTGVSRKVGYFTQPLRTLYIMSLQVKGSLIYIFYISCSNKKNHHCSVTNKIAFFGGVFKFEFMCMKGSPQEADDKRAAEKSDNNKKPPSNQDPQKAAHALIWDDFILNLFYRTLVSLCYLRIAS